MGKEGFEPSYRYAKWIYNPSLLTALPLTHTARAGLSYGEHLSKREGFGFFFSKTPALIEIPRPPSPAKKDNRAFYGAHTPDRFAHKAPTAPLPLQAPRRSLFPFRGNWAFGRRVSRRMGRRRLAAPWEPAKRPTSHAGVDPRRGSHRALVFDGGSEGRCCSNIIQSTKAVKLELWAVASTNASRRVGLGFEKTLPAPKADFYEINVTTPAWSKSNTAVGLCLRPQLFNYFRYNTSTYSFSSFSDSKI